MEIKTCEALNGMKPNPRVDIVCQGLSRTSKSRQCVSRAVTNLERQRFRVAVNDGVEFD